MGWRKATLSEASYCQYSSVCAGGGFTIYILQGFKIMNYIFVIIIYKRFIVF